MCMISYGYVKETKIYRAIYHHIAQDFIPLLTCHQLWCWLSPKTGDYFVLFKIHRAFYFSFFFYATKSCQIIKCRCPFLNNHKKAYAFTTQRKRPIHQIPAVKVHVQICNGFSASTCWLKCNATTLFQKKTIKNICSQGFPENIWSDANYFNWEFSWPC